MRKQSNNKQEQDLYDEISQLVAYLRLREVRRDLVPLCIWKKLATAHAMTGAVYAMFHGGVNYQAPSTYNFCDLEIFRSIPEAKREFSRRVQNKCGAYPCLKDPTMSIFKQLPYGDDYGSTLHGVFKVGPRGGIRFELH